MLVSLLSGLARSDVDPWLEAAKLAQMPGETATKELAALIGALPDRAASSPDSRMIATRLIRCCHTRLVPMAVRNRCRCTAHGW
jgi:hypothetical protein